MSRSARSRQRASKRPERPRLPIGQCLQLGIEKLVATGRALARVDGQVVFVDGLYPGDQAEVRIVELARDYAVAVPVRMLQPALRRRPSPCPLFQRCGGCDWLDLDDTQQLGLSLQIAQDAFARLLRHQTFPILGPIASPLRLGYRRRAQLNVDPDGRIGFFEHASRSVVPLTHCPILVPRLQALLAPLADLAPDLPGLREVHLLAGDDATAIALVASAPIPGSAPQLLARLAPTGATALALEDGTRRSAGPTSIGIRAAGYLFQAPVRSFFQGNIAFDDQLVTRVLAATLAPATGVPAPRRVLELYSGVGLFTLPLAASPCQVTAVELDPVACDALRQNLQAHALSATVLNLDASEVAPRVEALAPDAVLVDPPRAGLDASVRIALTRSRAARIAYLSCNLTTLARDLQALASDYSIAQVQLLDLFPQTAHLESLAILDRRLPPP